MTAPQRQQLGGPHVVDREAGERRPLGNVDVPPTATVGRFDREHPAQPVFAGAAQRLVRDLNDRLPCGC